MLIPLLVGAISCACQAGEEVKDKANVRSILKSGGGEQSQVERGGLRGRGAQA